MTREWNELPEVTNDLPSIAIFKHELDSDNTKIPSYYFDLKIISDSRIRAIIAKGPKYRFPVQIDFQKCCEKIAGSLNEFCNRWCKREHVECDALKDWKLNIFKIIDRRISFYS